VKPSDERIVARILEAKLATQEQVDECMAIRDKMTEMGLRPRPVADLLYERGYIQEEQLEEVHREERRFQGKEQIAGYRLLELLGEGAMGSVYKARQLSLDRDVAVKVLSPELARNEAYVHRFMTEAKAVARLNHTNIISGIDVGDASGIKYLVMEYAEGATVALVLRRGGAMDEERSLLIVQQIARALDHAHRNGLVHRDVKPDNVIITRDGVAKLCDLGLARLESGEGGAEEASRMGTADYMSPEQVRSQATDARTDLYSLGAMLFHMVTGRVPFEGANREAVMTKHLTSPVPSPRSLAPDLGEKTEAILRRLLAKNPADRFQSAAELLPPLDDAVRDLQRQRGVDPGAVVGAVGATRGAAAAAAGAAPAAPPAPEAPVRRRRR
jgi:serine/threonine protein kinase